MIIVIDQDFDQIFSAKAHNVGLSTCSISIRNDNDSYLFTPVILFSSIY